MSKKLLILITFLLVLVLFWVTNCNINSNQYGGLQRMRFGKNITIFVSDDETIDADNLQEVLNGNIKKETPYFDQWDNDELKNLIDYMRENNYSIVPGQYTFNQAWGFRNGVFVLNNGEKREIFKYQIKVDDLT